MYETVTDDQDREIDQLANDKGICYLEAKHIYFERKSGLNKFIDRDDDE